MAEKTAFDRLAEAVENERRDLSFPSGAPSHEPINLLLAEAVIELHKTQKKTNSLVGMLVGRGR